MTAALKRGWPLAAAAMAIAMSGPATAAPIPGLAAGGLARAGTPDTLVQPVAASRAKRANRQRASRHHDGAAYRGQIAVYETPYFGFHLGEQAYGPNGCRYPYSGYLVDQPCWAQKAFSPPRYR